jgi:TonB family protein
MQSTPTFSSSRLAFAAVFCLALSTGLIAQDVAVLSPEVMPVLNSCAIIEDRAERETCSNQGIMEHIINKLDYPQAAKKAGIEGTVVVKFVIDKTGRVSETKVMKGPEELSKAAQAVVKELPGFTPGLQKGKPVNVELVLPIRFALTND